MSKVLSAHELDDLVYASGGLPNFIGKNKSDEIEPDVDFEDPEQLARRAARNFLRHITRGTIVKSGAEGKSYAKCLALIERCVDKERSQELLNALREEMKIIFQNAAAWIIENDDPANEKQFEIFMHGLLALFPFTDPEETETIKLPQKVNHKWIEAEFQFKKIDISPQTGIIANCLKRLDKPNEVNKHRIYAYGLSPLTEQDPAIQAHLLLMGTTYPTGRGAGLSVLNNFRPGYSVGEGHDTTKLDEWINDPHNKSIIVSGQSQGAVMAMITAARHPAKISVAHCLNPTALNSGTFKRVSKKWNALSDDKRPVINAYVQKNDPVFGLEHGFLKGTHLYHIHPNHYHVSSYKRFLPEFIQRLSEAHLHNFCGRNFALILRGNIQQENNSRRRELKGDIKEGVNIVVFPFLVIDLCVNLRIEKWSPLIRKPLILLERIIAGSLIIAFLPTSVILATLISGFITAGRAIFNVRSEYQKAITPMSSTLIGASPTKMLVARGAIVTANHQTPLIDKIDGVAELKRDTRSYSHADVLASTYNGQRKEFAEPSKYSNGC
jgi:hypothetical protein